MDGTYRTRIMKITTLLRDVAEELEEENAEAYDRFGYRLEEMAEELDELIEEPEEGEEEEVEDDPFEDLE